MDVKGEEGRVLMGSEVWDEEGEGTVEVGDTDDREEDISEHRRTSPREFQMMKLREER